MFQLLSIYYSSGEDQTDMLLEDRPPMEEILNAVNKGVNSVNLHLISGRQYVNNGTTYGGLCGFLSNKVMIEMSKQIKINLLSQKLVL